MNANEFRIFTKIQTVDIVRKELNTISDNTLDFYFSHGYTPEYVIGGTIANSGLSNRELENIAHTIMEFVKANKYR